MKVPLVVVIGWMSFASASHAQPLPPEEAVDLLIHANHGLIPMSGERVMSTWARVRENPTPYLPFLREHGSLERMERAQDKEKLRDASNAIGILLDVGGEEDREAVATLFGQLSRKRLELSEQVRLLTPTPDAIASLESKVVFRQWVIRRNLMQHAELAVLRGFERVKDPRLCKPLLARLDDEREQGAYPRYIDYFTAACREDPLVRARLRKMVETTNSLTLESPLRLFFAR